jgi:citrate lyase beta subunit
MTAVFDETRRQPVHTVYGGAHLVRHDASQRLGALALQALDRYASERDDMARVFELAPIDHAEQVLARVREKLAREPVEDLRIDFEDGYGPRADTEEDMHCAAVVEALVRGARAATLPPYVGVRIKALSAETKTRAIRTLERVVGPLLDALGGVPAGFVVTLPKVESVAEVEALVARLDALEGSSAPRIAIEVMVETPAALGSIDGMPALMAFERAAKGRLRGAHFGAYDYTAALGVAAPCQRLDHPWCDLARHEMLRALAGTPVHIADGATTLLPVGPHRVLDGNPLTSAQHDENRAVVHAHWRLAKRNVMRALSQGIYQGWDLHPAQLVSRYVGVYDFFVQHLDDMIRRLRGFVASAARASREGGVFDDAATGQGMLNFVLRAIDVGALDADDASRRVGVSLQALRSRSFAVITA